MTRTFALFSAAAADRLDRATAQPLTVITAALTAAAGVASYSGAIDTPVVGLMPTGAILAFGGACALAWHRTATRRYPSLFAAAGFVAATALFLVRLVRVPDVPGSFSLGMLFTVAEEEMVFRLAATLLAWPVVRRAGARPEVAAVVCAVAPGLVFCFMPGHVAQMSSPVAALPFLVVALLHWWLTFSAARLSLAVLVHLAVNAMYSPLQYQMIGEVGAARVFVLGTLAAVFVYVGAGGLTRQCYELPSAATSTP